MDTFGQVHPTTCMDGYVQLGKHSNRKGVFSNPGSRSVFPWRFVHDERQRHATNLKQNKTNERSLVLKMAKMIHPSTEKAGVEALYKTSGMKLIVNALRRPKK